MFGGHGDVLAIKTHKANSLEYLKPNPRPKSAAPKPKPYPVVPSARVPPRRPQSAAASMRSYEPLEKSLTQKNIDGEYGPKMIGVTTYPYSNLQKLYNQDFRVLVASTITHPYMSTTGFNVGSVPHHILSGMNYDDDKMNGFKRWKTEMKREYMSKSIVEAKTRESCGIRSEQCMG